VAWHPDVTALILAGGKATRFGGIAKHELVVDGQTIFARQVALLRPHVTELIVSAPTDIPPYRTVRDATPGIGPLAGIAAGLSECRTSWLLVVAGDMPHLTVGVIDAMLDVVEEILELGLRGSTVPAAVHDAVRRTDASANVTAATDAVGVRSGGLPEPLLCVLHRRVLPVVEARVAAGRYKASGLLTDEGLRVAWIDAPDPAALRNVNSPEDL
jgi:molybdopterin-guanine dinucleotide biosynthesis protein A